MMHKIQYVVLLVACVALAAVAAPRGGLLSRGGFNGGQASSPALRQTPRTSMTGAPGRTTMPGRTTAPGGKAAAPSANAVATASAAKEEGGEASSSDLNFKDAPGEMVFEVYGKLVGRTVLKDPQTPTVTITLQSLPGQKLTKEEQIRAIETVMEMNGVHFEQYGEKFVRALPRKDVRKVGIPLITSPTDEPLDEVENVVSMMLDFKNIPVDEAQKALEGFKSNSGLLQVFERTNKILVTDSQMNINRMVEIARAIDIASPVLENVFVRQIKHAAASEIKTALEQIVTESQKEQEKNGKQQNSAAQNATRMGSLSAGPSLLRRPGMPGSPSQPATPSSVESLVTSVSDADRGMIRGKVLIIADERSNKLLIVTMKSNMDFFDKVIEQLDVETTPDVQVKVYRLKYADAEDVSAMINDLIGNSASSKSNAKQAAGSTTGSNGNLTRGTTGGATAAARQGANQRTGQSKAGELSKENVTVLADKRINGLVVMARTQDIPALEQIIESMDIKLSQVLIETCIIEVSLDDNLVTGFDWVHGIQKSSKDSAYRQALGGGGGSAKAVAGTTPGNNLIDNATVALPTIFTPGGAGLSYAMFSKKLDLAAIISASKTDSHSKYLASPIVMTVDNKEATIDATENRQFLTGWTAQSSGYSGGGQPTPNYSAKDIGLKLKIKPKINPNGTVMLNVEEEYSQFVKDGQSMLIPNTSSGTITYTPDNVDLAVERKMTADILLDNRQTVVLGGLTETKISESDAGIPILKDIPFIGRWLFGKTNQSEMRKELLVFMTPYVLDDAEAAQVEAIRRKRSMSDVKPWDDHGWSDSQLADPMSKKEILRRLKDEAQKQDDDRRNRIAAEEWKRERVKAMEAMDAEERKVWLEQHKNEIELERRKEEKRNEEEQKVLKEALDSLNTDGEVKK